MPHVHAGCVQSSLAFDLDKQHRLFRTTARVWCLQGYLMKPDKFLPIRRASVLRRDCRHQDLGHRYGRQCEVCPSTLLPAPDALENSTQEAASPVMDHQPVEDSDDEMLVQEEIPGEIVAVDPLASAESLP